MRTKERGSVVGYVVGAVVLLALLVGGILLYKNFAGNLDKAPVVGQTDTQRTETTNDDQSARNEAALKQQQEEAERKAQEQNQATNSTNGTGTAQQQPSQPAAQNQQPAATQVPHTSTAPANLPTTGPAEDAMLAAAGVATLAGVTAAYMRSRAAL